jgi:drug/metabolite transporter (DMT)-like permease
MSEASSVEQNKTEQSKSEHKFSGQLAVLATAVLWSTSGIAIKVNVWHPMVIAGFRSLLAAIFLIAVRFITRTRINRQNERFPFWAGSLAFASCMICFITANKLTTSANVIMLQYSAPVWAALLGWALVHEKPHWEHWGALVLVCSGLFLFFRDGLSAGAHLGDAISILSGVFLGSSSVFLRMMKKGNPQDAMFMGQLIVAVVCTPFFFLFPPSFDATVIASISFLGIFQAGLASVTFSYGIKRISAVQAMLIATAEPILNPIWVFILIGEKPSLTALAGGIIIIIAVVSSSLIGKYREDRELK